MKFSTIFLTLGLCALSQAAPPSSLQPRDSKIVCLSENAKFPKPSFVPNRNKEDSSAGGAAVTNCCKTIAGKFLAPGDPYLCDATIAGVLTTFSMHIIKGGFQVPPNLCVDEIFKVARTCQTPDHRGIYGGCATTEDGNIVSCMYI
ncbi:hypothetical protein ABW21_db0203537 [Orbilia brochopaga]|nr:hypothetical protein ABW21_db0203537 [Drechslerella brochopaga]